MTPNDPASRVLARVRAVADPGAIVEVYGSSVYAPAHASDVDVLVEYLPGRHPGLMLFAQQEELSRCCGRAVDLHTPASLSPYFRERVLAEALPIYGGL